MKISTQFLGRVSAFLLVAVFTITSLNAQNIGINNTGAAPDPSAKLDVVSTTQGILVPRMTSTQRLAISSPATGLLVFDNTIGNFMFYNGSFWQGINTDDQELSMKGDSILLEAGKGVDISKYLQTLSISDDTIKLTDGGYVVLPLADANLVIDTDLDTKIEVEKTADEDIIRMSTTGTEYWNFSAGRINYTNTGNSTFLGPYAGYNDDLTTNDNTMIGNYAGYTNTTGYDNVAIGNYAMYSGSGQYYNVAIGSYAMYNVGTSGGYNHAIGYRSMYDLTSGDYNNAMGNYTLYNLTSGGYNIAMGNRALYDNTTGSYNIALGSYSQYNTTTATNNISLGDRTMYYNTTGYGNIALGDDAMYDNTTGYNNIAVGQDAFENAQTGYHNVAIGTRAMQLGYGNPQYNTAVGYQVLQDARSSATYNTGMGYRAMENLTTGDYNVAIGSDALLDATTLSSMVAIGREAMENMTSGTFNVALGYQAMHGNSAYYSIAIGPQALYSTTSSAFDNIALGDNALYDVNTGDRNIGIGYSAGTNITSGYNNVAVGINSLDVNTTGYGNTAVGYNAGGYGSTGYLYSSHIGYNAVRTASYQIRLGHSSISSIGGYAYWSNISDARFKENIKEDVPGIDFIMKLRPVTYNLNVSKINEFTGMTHDQVDERGNPIDITEITKQDELKSKELQTGFIAQEVEEAAEELGYDFIGVDTPDSEEDHYSLRYAAFVVPMVKAMQEQQLMIEELKKEIEALKKEIEENK